MLATDLIDDSEYNGYDIDSKGIEAREADMEFENGKVVVVPPDTPWCVNSGRMAEIRTPSYNIGYMLHAAIPIVGSWLAGVRMHEKHLSVTFTQEVVL